MAKILFKPSSLMSTTSDLTMEYRRFSNSKQNVLRCKHSQLSQITHPKKKKTAKPNAKEIFGMEHSRIRWHYKYKERHKSFINMWIYRKTKQL